MSTPITLITVPKYVTISSSFAGSSNSGSNSCSSDEIDEFLIRGKRKRLDHLSWEEKLQRKKLKNRVAAQTSRDRKKAKMEDMETTVQELSDQNTTLKDRCDSLQSQNDKLVEKNNDLERRLNELERRLEIQHNASENVKKVTTCDVGCGTNNQGSAEGIIGARVDNTICEKEQQRHNSVMESNSSMPSLQDIFGDFDMSGLEELAESLLADVTTNMEDTDTKCSRRTTEIKGNEERVSERLVGTTTENLESGKNTNRSINERQLKKIHDDLVNSISIFEEPKSTINETKACDKTNDSETLYGTYDEKTNSITIVVTNDGIPIPIEEAIEEIIYEDEDDDNMSISGNESMYKDSITKMLSPIPNSCESNFGNDDKICVNSLSDQGYESVGSPSSEIHGFDELWNDSFTQLFPSLA